MKSKVLISSIITLAGLYALLLLVLGVIFYFGNYSFTGFFFVSVIFVFIQFLIAPFIMDFIMNIFYRIDFNTTMPDYLKNYIEQVCKNNNMKYPKIGYIYDGTPNAFTYGRTKNSARIILTKGIFDLLTPEEVIAVVSHELGHAVHYDMFLMTAAQIVPMFFKAIYDSCSHIKLSKHSDDKGKTAILQLIVAVISFILYIISEYLVLFFSRTREYFADEFAVTTTGNPNSLANALVKIGFGLVPRNNVNEGVDKSKLPKRSVANIGALGIFDAKTAQALSVCGSDESGVISQENIKRAARWELWNPWAVWYEFNSTHPLISKRLKAICKYCPTYNQPEYISFDEKQPESYVDDFFIEVCVQFLPYVVFMVMTTISIFGFIYSPFGLAMFVLGLALTLLASFIPFFRRHKKGFKEKTVLDLLGEVKVSGVTCVPCIVKGELIGRGNAGNLLNEDFVIRDHTGIVFLDYRQPLYIINKLFALLKSDQYLNKVATITGWYRRSPVPYIEIYQMQVEGEETKTCYTYIVTIIFRIIALLACLFFSAILFMSAIAPI